MNGLQERLNRLTLKWWFYLLFLLLFFLPSYTSLPFNAQNTPQLITAVLSDPLVYTYPVFFPLFKLIPLVLVIAILKFGNQAATLFFLYVTALITGLGIFQNTAVTEEYGLAIITGNVVVYLFVALAWMLELFNRNSDFSQPSHTARRYWVIPVALFALLGPVDETTYHLDFSLVTLLGNAMGLTLCTTLPLFMAVLILNHPRINLVTLRITGFAGIITALFNMLQWFLLNPHYWLGALHLPLLSISAYGFWLSFRGGNRDEIGV